jgi:DNA processing protein
MPSHLAELADAPEVLYCRGVLPTRPGVAIVGTRRATPYGRAISRSFGRAVATAGWPVVSGLARGVDGLAHEGTLEVGGIGVAVLGSGIDVWYPAEHRRLGEGLISGGGAVVSEFGPGTPPEPWRFPCRNRIISGLSKVVVVIEAARTGGALITARLALDQGRDVMAVPGDIGRPASEGCNLLIRDGAIPVLGAEDLIEALTLLLGAPPSSPAKPHTGSDLMALIPAGGIPLEDLVLAHGTPTPFVLAELARLEAGGFIHIDGGNVAAL